MVEPYTTNAIADFTKPSISIHPIQKVGIVGQDIILKYTVRNVKTIELRFYKYNGYRISYKVKPVKTVDLNPNDSVPTVEVKDSVAVQLPVGRYSYTVTLNGKN